MNLVSQIQDHYRDYLVQTFGDDANGMEPLPMFLAVPGPTEVAVFTRSESETSIGKLVKAIECYVANSGNHVLFQDVRYTPLSLAMAA